MRGDGAITALLSCKLIEYDDEEAKYI